jgi:hypothetical protein
MTLYSVDIKGNLAGHGVWRRRDRNCGRRTLIVLSGEWRGRNARIEGRVWPPAAAGNSTPPFTMQPL